MDDRTLVQRLASIRDVAPLLAEHRDDYDEVLPYVFLADVTRWLVATAESGGDAGPVGQALAVLTHAYESGDDRARDLVVGGVLENLPPPESGHPVWRLIGEPLRSAPRGLSDRRYGAAGMIEVSLGRLGRARVWFANRPARLAEDERGRVELRGGRATVRRPEVAVELWVPRGGFAEYGLLGATYRAGGRLSAVVLADAPAAVSPVPGLAVAPDRATVGLPAELVTGIRRALAFMDATDLVPADGVLTVDCGAYGDIGSSAVTFERLTNAVLRLLAVDSVSAGHISDVVEESIRWGAR